MAADQIAHAQESTPQTHGGSLLLHALHAANYRLGRLGKALVDAPAEVATVWQSASEASASTDGIVTLTYWLIVMLIGCGLEWFYWTYAAASLRVIDETIIESASQPFGLRCAVCTARRRTCSVRHCHFRQSYLFRMACWL